jgi:hypothetical protein
MAASKSLTDFVPVPGLASGMVVRPRPREVIPEMGLKAEFDRLTSKFAGIFEMMEAAEEEIAEAIDRHPMKRDIIWNSFTILQPSEILRDLSMQVYRAHCKELLERVAIGVDTRPGTKAEVLGAISNLSTVAPLKSDVAYLMQKIMVDVFGYNPAGDISLYESYKGASDEICSDMQKKLYVKDRLPKVNKELG